MNKAVLILVIATFACFYGVSAGYNGILSQYYSASGCAAADLESATARVANMCTFLVTQPSYVYFNCSDAGVRLFKTTFYISKGIAVLPVLLFFVWVEIL